MNAAMPLLLQDNGASPGMVVLLVIIAILLIILFIWLLLRWREQKPAAPSATRAAPAAIAETPPPAPPIDDLEIIEGIGPKIGGILKAAGVTSFAQLAAMTPDEIGAIVKAGGVTLFNAGSWPRQAKLAADGDMAALEELQKTLTAGRE